MNEGLLPEGRGWLGAFVGCLMLCCAGAAAAQDLNFSASRAVVDFSRKLQAWDGFGFNYVETAQTLDYRDDPQDYGGFSMLAETDRLKLIELVFGDEGLKVGLLKMFCDPLHQTAAGRPYDHQTTTKYLRYFAREGVKMTRAAGRDLTIVTTLYGPPGYMTKQKVLRGRDLDPAHTAELVEYLVSWVRFLREKEGLPVKYVSLHNEGEDWSRWTRAGLTDNPGHDYNLFWPPEQVVEFIKLVDNRLQRAGLKEVRVTPGENTNWYRWGGWGYADAIAADDDALARLGLITSHGFYSGIYGRWFGEHQSAGTDRLRSLRPDLRAWVTSTSWGKMDAQNIREHHGNIYSAKVNGIIPWAGIQRPPKWVGGDPNPGSAITVREDGSFEVRQGYYFYKQISRAGQPGMAVVQTSVMDSELAVLAFASNGTTNSDVFVVINLGGDRTVNVRIKGSPAERFMAYRTTNDEKERYNAIGEFAPQQGTLAYRVPGGSVTTFFASE
jgi:O-glycosyl hydrolase